MSVAPPPGRQPRDAANLHSRSVLRQVLPATACGLKKWCVCVCACVRIPGIFVGIHLELRCWGVGSGAFGSGCSISFRTWVVKNAGPSEDPI